MTNAGIDITNPAPRVNFELMAQYIGKRVTLVGKTEGTGLANGVLRVKAADNGVVDVAVSSMIPEGDYLEINGVVESPNTIREQGIVSLGNSFDMNNYNEVCKLINGNYKSIFL